VNEVELLRELNADLQTAPAGKVIYLEGKTDLPIFFALLGVPAPRDGVYHGVYVRALKDNSGMGGSSVMMRVELALARGYRGVRGVIDGDGEALAALARRFDAPFAGPLFTWKGYAIENLLVKTGWPTAWGAAPSFLQVLLDHAPYVALNRIYRQLQGRLETLHLSRYNRPTLSAPLMSVDDVTLALERDRDLVRGYDVAAQFRTEVATFVALVGGSEDEGHALVDGKWLVNVFAPRRLGMTPAAAREAWIAHGRAAGGLSEVRGLWERVAGRPPR